MPDPAAPRSVKIPSDERTGWSSERPRRDGAPPRPPDLSVRSRVLRPSSRLSYLPGSLLVVQGAVATQPENFVQRVLEERGLALSLHQVRTLLAGRATPETIEARSHELLEAAIKKRIAAGETVVVAISGFDAVERESYVRLAHAHRRPRHLILIEGSRAEVLDDERADLDELRRALDAGELGKQGFQTALRLGGNALGELKRIVFARPSADD
jgi:predicted kinase